MGKRHQFQAFEKNCLCVRRLLVYKASKAFFLLGFYKCFIARVKQSYMMIQIYKASCSWSNSIIFYSIAAKLRMTSGHAPARTSLQCLQGESVTGANLEVSHSVAALNLPQLG